MTAERIEDCTKIGLEHVIQFVVAAHGYQCFECVVCGHMADVVEDSQP